MLPQEYQDKYFKHFANKIKKLSLIPYHRCHLKHLQSIISRPTTIREVVDLTHVGRDLRKRIKLCDIVEPEYENT